MIVELWGCPNGRIFYQLDNWFGFYKCEPLLDGRDNVNSLPADARPLISDGVWVAGVMEAADAEAANRFLDPELPTETASQRRSRDRARARAAADLEWIQRGLEWMATQTDPPSNGEAL